MPSGLFYHNSLDRSILYIRGVWLVFIIIMTFLEISEFNANRVDPYELGLHGSPVRFMESYA